MELAINYLYLAIDNIYGARDGDQIYLNYFRREIQLTSLLKLRSEVASGTHKGLSDIIRSHTFVGCVDDSMALIQHNTALYLCRTLHLW